MLGDHRDAVALTPHLQLLDGGGAEGIAGGEHDLLALTLQLLGQLADGGGLAHAVHADHKNHVGLLLGGDQQRLLDRLEQRAQLFLQGLVQRTAVGQLLARHAFGQAVDDDTGGLDADVGGEQARLQLFEQVIVDGLLAEEQTGHALAQAGAGLRQALLEAGEPAALVVAGLALLDLHGGGFGLRLRLGQHLDRQRLLVHRMGNFGAGIDAKA